MSDRDTPRMFATATSSREDNRKIVFRFIQSFEAGFDAALYPQRVIIVWTYAGQNGQPVVHERLRMENMEDALAQNIDAQLTILVLVSTGDDLREWTYYTQSEETFMLALNRALADQPDCPIEIHAAPDPEWTTYWLFRTGVVGVPAELE